MGEYYDEKTKKRSSRMDRLTRNVDERYRESDIPRASRDVRLIVVGHIPSVLRNDLFHN